MQIYIHMRTYIYIYPVAIRVEMRLPIDCSLLATPCVGLRGKHQRHKYPWRLLSRDRVWVRYIGVSPDVLVTVYTLSPSFQTFQLSIRPQGPMATSTAGPNSVGFSAFPKNELGGNGY